MTPDEINKLRSLLLGIFERAVDHPTVDMRFVFTKKPNITALAKIGGDTFDWTMTAIEAREALRILYEDAIERIGGPSKEAGVRSDGCSRG